MSSAAKRVAATTIALLLAAPRVLLANCCEGWQTVAASPVAKQRPPAIVKAIDDARGRLDFVRKALPPLQETQAEALEGQDFVQQIYADGALRLLVSPGGRGEIFALLVDTRAPHHRAYVDLTSAPDYVTYHRDPYVLVLPVRPVRPDVFSSLESRRWTKSALRQALGAPSFDWHVHGVGYFGFTYVPQGLSFIGDSLYQLDGPGMEMGEGDLPPIESLAKLDYATLQRAIRDAFANDLLCQRATLDQAVAGGKPSPDGRFVVSHVNLEGLANTEEVVVGERGKPERRFHAPHFTYDKDYRWLDGRTILFEAYVFDQEFYTVDALTGASKRVASIPDESAKAVVAFDVSDPHTFWYKTADGVRHDVVVSSADRLASDRKTAAAHDK